LASSKLKKSIKGSVMGKKLIVIKTLNNDFAMSLSVSIRRKERQID